MNSQFLSDADVENDEAIENEFPYRVMSKSAVIAAVLAVLSIAGFLLPGLLVLALVGALFGIQALYKFRCFPQEYSGASVALVGTIASSAVLVLGAAYHIIEYATEVPDGYQRISFADLQPDSQSPVMFPPESAFGLSGKKVFIKGYMYPDGRNHNITRFVLIPDLGTCCFGGQPKLTNMVQVSLQDPLSYSFERRKRRLAGTFKVDTQVKPVDGLGGVYYELDASIAK